MSHAKTQNANNDAEIPGSCRALNPGVGLRCIIAYVPALRGVEVEVGRALEQRHDAGEERLVHRVAVDEVHAVADPGETAEEGGEVRGGARQAAQLQPRICTQPSAATRCAAAFVSAVLTEQS